MILTAYPRLLLVVARTQRAIKRSDRRLDRGPLVAAILVLGRAGLKTSLIGIRARVADVLIAIGLGKEHPQADTAGYLGI
jgi:hypothetical protein